jgi:hypothetical protein
MSVLAACTLGFGVVLVLLAFMAVVMAVLTRVFPAPAAPARTDAAVESAIAQAVHSAFGGARVSRIREIR